jgi:hypothetical protein
MKEWSRKYKALRDIASLWRSQHSLGTEVLGLVSGRSELIAMFRSNQTACQGTPTLARGLFG